MDLSSFDTSNVEDMSSIFDGCNTLQSIYSIEKLHTSNAKIMSSMFKDCTEIEYNDLTNFKTSNVIEMSYMFYYMHLLK